MLNKLGISRSVYYDWKKQGISPQKKRKIEVKEKINLQLPEVAGIIKESDELTNLFNIQNMLFKKKEKLSLANQALRELEQTKRDIEQLKLKKAAIRECLVDSDIDKVKGEFISYSNELVKRLYPDSYKSHFDINVIAYNKINTSKIPVVFDFGINKDNSEGVRNAKNVIVDLLMLKHSKTIDFMAWDSTTFNGIDPNQLQVLFKEINSISQNTEKQIIIICFNSFQLGDYYEVFSKGVISGVNKVVFNNNSTLLNRDF